MKILGLLFVAFGGVDLVGSYTGFDLWVEYIGVQLPGLIWKYSSFIEIGFGIFLFNIDNCLIFNSNRDKNALRSLEEADEI